MSAGDFSFFNFFFEKMENVHLLPERSLHTIVNISVLSWKTVFRVKYDVLLKFLFKDLLETAFMSKKLK